MNCGKVMPLQFILTWIRIQENTAAPTDSKLTKGTEICIQP